MTSTHNYAKRYNPIIGIALFSALTLFNLPANAEMSDASNGEHSVANVDLFQPIAAIDNLTSLQHDEKLEMTLPEIQHFTTSNGVPVIFFETNQLPIVDIDLRFNAGSARDESIKKGGFGLASLVANLLTKGTINLDETEFAKATEQLGIELTSTAYKDQFVVTLRSLSDEKNLNTAVNLLSDMINEPRFDQEVLQRLQAQKILGIKQMQQSPSYVASTTFSKSLYGNHPYAHSSYGTVASVPSLTTSDLEQFRNRYLVANNASLSITGDLTLTEAKEIAEAATQGMRLGEAAPKLPQPTPITENKRIHVDHDSDQTYVVIGQLGYQVAADPASLNQRTKFAIGNEVLAGSGFNSRLMSKVRKDLGYTYGIYGSMSPMQVAGPYTIKFSTRNEKAEEAIDATLDTVNNTLENGITQQEFELTKESLINSFPMGFSSNAGINGLLGSLNFNKLPDSYVTEYIDRIEDTTIDGVNQNLKETIDPDHFVIVTVGRSE